VHCASFRICRAAVRPADWIAGHLAGDNRLLRNKDYHLRLESSLTGHQRIIHVVTVENGEEFLIAAEPSAADNVVLRLEQWRRRRMLIIGARECKQNVP